MIKYLIKIKEYPSLHYPEERISQYYRLQCNTIGSAEKDSKDNDVEWGFPHVAMPGSKRVM